MKLKQISFFSVAPLQEAGGYERFQIETANSLAKIHPELEIKIINFDENLLEKYHKLLNFYQRQPASPLKESYQQVLNKLDKNITLVQVANLKEIKSELNKCTLLYTKNELVELTLLRLLAPKIPHIIGFATAIFYPKADNLRGKLHNFLYSHQPYSSYLKRAKILHVKNLQDYQILQKRFPSSQVSYIPNGYNFDHTNTKLSQELAEKFDSQKLNIVWTGRLTEQKGIDRLCRIIKQVNQQRNAKIAWHIAGDGEQVDLVKKIVAEESNVLYYGHIDQKKILSFVGHGQLYASTSLWETFGSSMVEALSVGVPVVSFDISGPDQFISSGQNGFLVESEEQYVQTIVDIIDKKIKFSKNIQQEIMSKLSFDIIANQFYDMLTSERIHQNE